MHKGCKCSGPECETVNMSLAVLVEVDIWMSVVSQCRLLLVACVRVL